MPAVAAAAAAPMASASSTFAWEIDLEPLDQDCGPGSNGGATTYSGWSATNTAAPTSGTNTGPVVVTLSMLIYTNTLYDSVAAAQTDLNAANAAFTANPPAAASNPVGSVSNGAWSLTSSSVLDLGDGTYLPASAYQSQATVLGGIAPGTSMTNSLTVKDLPNGFSTQGVLTPITAVNAKGDYGADVFLWDSAYCGVFPPDMDAAAAKNTPERAPGTTTPGTATERPSKPVTIRGFKTGRICYLHRRAPAPKVQTWFRSHYHKRR